jgi:hypothetical protein
VKSTLLSLVVVAALVTSAGSARAQRMRGGFATPRMNPMMMNGSPFMRNTSPFAGARFHAASGAHPNFGNKRLINPSFNSASGAMSNFGNAGHIHPPASNMSPFHSQFVLPTSHQASANRTVLANNAGSNRTLFIPGGTFGGTFVPNNRNILSGSLDPTTNALRLTSARVPYEVLSGTPITPANALLSPYGFRSGLSPYTSQAYWLSPTFWGGSGVPGVWGGNSRWGSPFTGLGLWPYGGWGGWGWGIWGWGGWGWDWYDNYFGPDYSSWLW